MSIFFIYDLALKCGAATRVGFRSNVIFIPKKSPDYRLLSGLEAGVGGSNFFSRNGSRSQSFYGNGSGSQKLAEFRTPLQDCAEIPFRFRGFMCFCEFPFRSVNTETTWLRSVGKTDFRTALAGRHTFAAILVFTDLGLACLPVTLHDRNNKKPGTWLPISRLSLCPRYRFRSRTISSFEKELRKLA